MTTNNVPNLATGTAEFDSERACEAAALSVKVQLSTFETRFGTTIKTLCTPKQM
jgi:hypothetical protein